MPTATATMTCSTSPTTSTRHPHAGRWPRTARLVWRERVETNSKGQSIFVWDEVWTRPSRKFGRSKAGRLQQVAEIPELASHFPRLIKVNHQNGVLTLARPNFDRQAELSHLDALTLRRLKRELKAIYNSLYDHAIAYVFSPDGFQIRAETKTSDWTVYIDGWSQASRHKVREPGAKKTAYFVEMEEEQLQKIDAYFAPLESRARQKISALMNPEPA